jgi:hypothetical protein
MTRLKPAELTSGVGAPALGVGLGALFATGVGPAAGLITLAGDFQPGEQRHHQAESHPLQGQQATGEQRARREGSGHGAGTARGGPHLNRRRIPSQPEKTALGGIVMTRACGAPMRRSMRASMVFDVMQPPVASLHVGAPRVMRGVA